MIKWSELTTEERDRLVWEKVMNLSPTCRGKLEYIITDRSMGEVNHYFCQECEAKLSKFSTEHSRKVPHYSTDMNAAWEVMQKMTAIEMEDIGNKEKREKRDNFDCALMSAVGPLIKGVYTHALIAYHIAKLTPRIICLAALKACGMEIEP